MNSAGSNSQIAFKLRVWEPNFTQQVGKVGIPAGGGCSQPAKKLTKALAPGVGRRRRERERARGPCHCDEALKENTYEALRRRTGRVEAWRGRVFLNFFGS